MHTHRRSFLLGLAALALAGCASAPKPELSRIQDPNADFHAYRTFAFYPGRGGGYTSIFERRLLDAARRQLERRGYVFDMLAPDVLVTVGAVVEERQALRRVPGHFPGGDGVETEDYRQGRLAIDLIDVRRREVVWRGIAEGRVSDAMLHNAGAAAEKAVEAVFEAFPIQPGARAAATTAPTPR